MAAFPIPYPHISAFYICCRAGLIVTLFHFSGLKLLAAQDPPGTVVIHVMPGEKLPLAPGGSQNVYYASISELTGEISRHYNSGASEITVKFHGGNYFLTAPLMLQHLKKNTILRLEAFNDETVSLSGAVRLTGVTRVTDPGVLKRLPAQAQTKIFQVKIQEAMRDFVKVTVQGRGFEFYNDGEPLKVTTYPETEGGWLYTGEVTRGDGNLIRVGYTAPDRISLTPDRNIYLFGYWNRDWYGEHQLVKEWDPAGRVLTLPVTSQYGYGSAQKFKFFNILEKLDQPGEMYFDAENAIPYFWPWNTSTDVYLNAGRNGIFYLQNVRNVRIRGLVLRDTHVPAAQIRNSEDVELEDCLIKHVITNGIEISGGKNCGIVNSEITQIGASAITLSGGDRNSLVPSSHYVRNCNLSFFAQIQRVYKPAIMLEGVGQVVSNCHIHHAPHMGIRIAGNNHPIELSEFSFLALESGDVGAIYSGRDWTFRGNSIRNNYFHDLKGTGQLGAVAVYIDDLGSGFEVSGNVFYKCNKAVQIGGGRDNIVDNNIFVACGIAVKIDNRGETNAKSQASPGGSWKMYEKLNAVPVKSDIYKNAFPGLASIETNSPLRPLGNQVINNVSADSEFLSIKPNDKNYWNEVLLQQNNLQAPSISAGQPVEKVIGNINNYAAARNNKFRPVNLQLTGLKDDGR